MLEEESTSSRHSVCQLSAKLDNFEFFDPNLPKNGFRFWNSKNYYWKKNQKPWDNICTNFQVRQTTLTFLAQICPKRKSGFEIQKTNVGLRISILEILCVPIFRQNGQLWIFGLKFAQKWILGSKFQKSKSGFGINISNISCVPMFSKNGQLLIFQPKFREIAQLRAIFWPKYCRGCCRELGGDWNELGGGGWSWVEVEMS